MGGAAWRTPRDHRADLECERDRIFFAERGFDAPAVEMALGAITLNAPRSVGETGASVALDSLLDG
jgi:hypothetical protein